MAHLEVEPKQSRPWWIWALVALLVILLTGLLLNTCSPDYARSIANNVSAK